MSSAATRYHVRAPRYVFRLADEKTVRFSTSESSVESSTTVTAKARDVSATGMAFTVHPDEAPEVGELLKLEFQVPGSSSVAWFANVVRVEERSEWDADLGSRSFMIVAVQFHKAPTMVATSIAKAVAQAIRHTTVGPADPLPPIEFKKLTNKQALLLAALALAVIGSFILMSIPPTAWATSLG